MVLVSWDYAGHYAGTTQTLHVWKRTHLQWRISRGTTRQPYAAHSMTPPLGGLLSALGLRMRCAGTARTLQRPSLQRHQNRENRNEMKWGRYYAHPARMETFELVTSRRTTRRAARALRRPCAHADMCSEDTSPVHENHAEGCAGTTQALRVLRH